MGMKNIILGLPNFLQEAHMADSNGLIPLALFINAIARLLEALRKMAALNRLPLPSQARRSVTGLAH